MKKETEFIYQDNPTEAEKKQLEKHGKELIEFADHDTILIRVRKRMIDKTIWLIKYSKCLNDITFSKLDVAKFKRENGQAKKDAEEAMRVHVIKGSKKIN